nr:MAG TPA: hypothetical protein [Caudoviricetes sp.]
MINKTIIFFFKSVNDFSIPFIVVNGVNSPQQTFTGYV